MRARHRRLKLTTETLRNLASTQLVWARGAGTLQDTDPTRSLVPTKDTDSVTLTPTDSDTDGASDQSTALYGCHRR